MPQQLSNLDDASNFYFAQELELVKTTVYNTDFPAFVAREALPVNLNTDPSALEIVYRQYTRVGMAKIIHSYSDDLPRVDLYGEEVRSKVFTIGDSFGYTTADIRNAASTGRSLPAAKAVAAKEAMMHKEDELAITGLSALNIIGFANSSNVPQIDAATVNAQTEWSEGTKSALQILADIFAGVNAVQLATKGLEKPNALALPTTQYNILDQVVMPNTTMTLMEHLKDKNRFPGGIYMMPKLAGAGEGGTDRMVVYVKDPSKLSLEIPMDFMAHDGQPRNLEVVVPCEERFGGVLWPKPLSAVYVDGI